MKAPTTRSLLGLLVIVLAGLPLTSSANDSATAIVESYLLQQQKRGFGRRNHGLWFSTGAQPLIAHQATKALPAASVTKVATTLAALQMLGPDHRFITLFSATAPIRNRRLQGDLIVSGSGDPFFVWEDAILIANQLQQLGIDRISGDLIVSPDFYMNFQQRSDIAGDLLRQAFHHQRWSTEANQQYATLPPGTARPTLHIDGNVRIAPNAIASSAQPLLRHHSFPLAELLKKMNLYSNNKMAEMIASALGGAKVIAQTVAAATRRPQSEFQLSNGSGLGESNRISPQGAAAMFSAIQRTLRPFDMTIGDVFALVGQDVGVLAARSLPKHAVLKSGSLSKVSALAGVLPSQQGLIWFGLTNYGQNLREFRREQERLLARLLTHWGVAKHPLSALMPNVKRQRLVPYDELLQTR